MILAIRIGPQAAFTLIVFYLLKEGLSGSPKKNFKSNPASTTSVAYIVIKQLYYEIAIITYPLFYLFFVDGFLYEGR
jgi:hypothetical protein